MPETEDLMESTEMERINLSVPAWIKRRLEAQALRNSTNLNHECRQILSWYYLSEDWGFLRRLFWDLFFR